MTSTALPTPPVGSFASDNTAAVAPEVFEALARANTGTALAYGEDPWTEQAVAAVRRAVGVPEAEVLLCWGGTGANVVGLTSLVQPWQQVICSDSAHIVVDECGAPARFSGATVTPVPSPDGKLTLDAFAPFLDWQGTVHHPQPRVLSISQATELGTTYSHDELGALCDAAHAAGLLVYLDGARIANAVAASGSDLPAMVRDTGVDAFTFGITKNGAMYGEAVVYLRPELAPHAAFVRKQAGQLVSKSRYVAAQLLALLEDDLWLRQAAHANAMARQLADRVRDIDGVTLLAEPAVNSLFAQVPPSAIEPLQDWSFFWGWDPSRHLVRWMTSFSTTEADVEAFAAGIAAIVGEHR